MGLSNGSKSIIRIEKWLGINENPAGDMSLLPGEAVVIKNFRITPEGYLALRAGFTRLALPVPSPVRGMWSGVLGGVSVLLTVSGGTLWRIDGTGTSSVGTLADLDTYFLPFGGKVYLLNGDDYLSYNGVSLTPVEGYAPLVVTATPPAGGGAQNEEINLLTPKKRQLFSGNGSSVTYQLAETYIASVYSVKVNGVSVTTFTVNPAAGTVQFTTAPAAGVNNVEIAWSKANNGRDAVTAMRFGAVFGGQNDTRLFISGDGSNRVLHTGLAAGFPSGEYFPASSFLDVDAENTPVKALTRHYDRLLILKEDSSYVCSYNAETTAAGDYVAAFTVLPVNSKIGCNSMGNAVLIDNDPIAPSSGGLFRWRTTSTRDERNATLISGRVRETFASLDMDGLRTCDCEKTRELVLASGRTMLIYSYAADAFYVYELAGEETVTALASHAGKLHIGLSDGRILFCDEDSRDDDGEKIKAAFESGAYAFGSEWEEKSLRRFWLLMRPVTGGRLTVTLRASRGGDSETVAAAGLFGFDHMSFAHLSCGTNRRPKTVRLPIKLRGFTHLKLLFSSDSDTAAATVLACVFELLASRGAR